MDTETQKIIRRVNEARREKGVDILPLSRRTGIPYATLYRILEQGADPKVSQLFLIANELKADASSWFSDNAAGVAA